MLYSLHEAAYNSATPIRMAARAARDFWGSPLNPAGASQWGRRLYASADLRRQPDPPLRPPGLGHRQRRR